MDSAAGGRTPTYGCHRKSANATVIRKQRRDKLHEIATNEHGSVRTSVYLSSILSPTSENDLYIARRADSPMEEYVSGAARTARARWLHTALVQKKELARMKWKPCDVTDRSVSDIRDEIVKMGDALRNPAPNEVGPLWMDLRLRRLIVMLRAKSASRNHPGQTCRRHYLPRHRPTGRRTVRRRVRASSRAGPARPDEPEPPLGAGSRDRRRA